MTSLSALCRGIEYYKSPSALQPSHVLRMKVACAYIGSLLTGINEAPKATGKYLAKEGRDKSVPDVVLSCVFLSLPSKTPAGKNK